MTVKDSTLIEVKKTTLVFLKSLAAQNKAQFKKDGSAKGKLHMKAIVQVALEEYAHKRGLKDDKDS